MRKLLSAGLALWLSLAAALAQDLSALARLDPAASSLTRSGQSVELVLALSQPVPWRVRLLDEPPRVVLDFREVDLAPLPGVLLDADSVTDLRAGVFRQGWSRLVMELSRPMSVTLAEMQTGAEVPGGGARLTLRLSPTTLEEFAARAALPEPPEWAAPEPAAVPPRTEKAADAPMIVVLDPGHGGIDPGAEREGVTEADLMLTFARELKEALLRAGGFEVVLTRDDDVFVSLEGRISIAHAAEADALISLHADALAEGEAVGATIYTLAEDASEAAAATLAERHDRDDLLAGVDLSDQDDLVATVLMDMARTETAPRTDLLAENLMIAMQGSEIRMHRIPRQAARFSVLKSADIPSVLIELGFLSSARDLARLTDPAWRARMAAAIVTGLQAWRIEDQARQQLKRQ